MWIVSKSMFHSLMADDLSTTLYSSNVLLFFFFSFFVHRDDNSVIAKMNILFDKAIFEKASIVKTEHNNDIQPNTADGDENGSGKVVKDTILNSIQSAKLGALSVDPEFLEFHALECKFNTQKRKLNCSRNNVTVFFFQNSLSICSKVR